MRNAVEEDPFAAPPEWANDEPELTAAQRFRIEAEERETAFRASARRRARLRAVWAEWWRVGALAVAAVVVVAVIPAGVWALWFRTDPHEVAVLELAWERTIEVEEYRLSDRRSWSEPTPGYQDDRNQTFVVESSIHSRREERSSWCMARSKDGFCTVWHTDYDDRWYWDEWSWGRNGESLTEESRTGAAGYVEPVWPVRPEAWGELPELPELGDRRLSESRRWEILTMFAAGPSGVFEWVSPRGVWGRAQVGDSATANVTVTGHVRSIVLHTGDPS